MTMSCLYCKDTKQILLLDTYVECLDCKTPNGWENLFNNKSQLLKLTQAINKSISNFKQQEIKLELKDRFNLIGNSQYGPVGLDNNDCRLIICGQSGCGKTHLVRNYLNTLIEKNKYKILIVDPEQEYTEFPEIKSKIKDISEEVTNEKNIYSILEYSFKNNDVVLFSMHHKDNMKIITEINTQFLKLLETRNINYKSIYIHDSILTTRPSLHLSNKENIQSYKNSLKFLQRDGRNKGLSTIFVTQRLSRVHNDIIAECNNFLIGKTINETDIKQNRYFIKKMRPKDQNIMKTLNKEFIASGLSFNFDSSQYVKLLK